MRAPRDEKRRGEDRASGATDNWGKEKSERYTLDVPVCIGLLYMSDWIDSLIGEIQIGNY